MEEQDILFETGRFNLSEVKDHFINDCCFGEDAAAWLHGELTAAGLAPTEPGQEDWGWYLEVADGGARYFLGVSGASAEEDRDPDLGEWRIMVEKRRTLAERLTGRNRLRADEPLLTLIRTIVAAQPDFQPLAP